MFNIKKKNKLLNKLIEHSNLTTKVCVYMSTQTAGDDFDPYEKKYERSDLNPLTIKCFVSDISPDVAYYKGYGQQIQGAKQILCSDRFREAFENCSKIKIDNNEYEVFRDGTSGKTSILSAPNLMIRVILTRKF